MMTNSVVWHEDEIVRDSTCRRRGQKEAIWALIALWISDVRAI